MAVELNITVRSKRVPWGGATGEADIVVIGEDWSDATFKMEIRPEPGHSATALVTLENAAVGEEGISATYDAGYLHPTTGAAVGATIIRPQISEGTMEALATASAPEDPVEAYYDLHLQPADSIKRLFVYGRFTYHPGVTL